MGFIDEKIAYATRMLGLLNDANELKQSAKRVDYQEFYNDAVNNIVDLRQDYRRWVRANRAHRSGAVFDDFSFSAYPYILSPASKSKLLNFDATVQQQEEFNQAMYTALLGLQRTSLYLVLKVRRDNLIYTTLSEIMAKRNDLKKPLRVVFIGEEGVDDGGVRKEFFQLVLREVFNPMRDLFLYDEKNRYFWFNGYSFESLEEFKLVGIILGLAIYNSQLLDIKLPRVVYKKLLGQSDDLTLEDLKDLDPELAQGLEHLLSFDGDVENVYCRTFEVETEVFGTMHKHELKPGGSSIPVTNDNRKEYVDLFVKWKLVESVQKQFDAFLEGFRMVVDSGTLKLFRPEELEIMVVGTNEMNFDELERSAKYGSGYTKDHKTI